MTLLQLIALLWINGCLLLAIYTNLKGREIAKYLQKKYPDKWKDLGKPQPRLFGPSQTWSLFLSNEEYHSFNDRRLTKMCERQRRVERITITIFILSFVSLGGIALWDLYVN